MHPDTIIAWSLSCRRGDIRSFYRFMSVGKGTRYQHFKSLTISLHQSPKNRVTKRLFLLLLFRSRTTLEKLVIRGTALIDKHRELGIAICTLPNLKEFTMSSRNMSYEPLIMLLIMRSKVVKANIVLPKDDDYLIDDPVKLLRNFSSSLEQLDVTSVDFIAVDIQYPEMKHLRVGLWESYTISPLVLAYPNLLTLITRRGDVHFGPRLDTRRRNKKSFQQQTSWQFLDHVSAYIEELYILAICCKIRYLDLHCLQTHSEVGMLCAVLSDCRPSLLRIPFLGFNMDLFPTVARSIPSDLEHLILSVDLKPYSPPQLGPILDLLLESLPSLTMNKLELGLGREVPRYIPGFNGKEMPNLEPLPMDLFLRNLDAKALACRIMSSVPSLKYLHLELFHNDQANSYWRMEEEGDHRIIRELDCELGEKVIFKKEFEHPFS